jgi:elongation of very long chain fatty acids protein 6
MELYNSFTEFEKNYQGEDAIAWTRNHAEIPVFAVGLYLWFIFYFPKMQEWGILPNINLRLKTLFALWNMLLSLFSIIGATRVVPHLIHELKTEGFFYTVCGNSRERYRDGPVGLWTMLFIYSKFPELLDTAFLVVQKKKVIFLHWFHHTTVLMYCWHAFHNAVSQGIWFAAMNLSVHGIMYFYYFMGAINLRKIVRPFAKFITTIQILQMVGGIAVTVTAASHHNNDDPAACYTDAANWKMGLGMYSVYCGLFVVLFANLYCTKKDKNLSSRGLATPASRKAAKAAAQAAAQAGKNPDSPTTGGILCSTYNPALDVGDAVGLFHGHQHQDDIDESGGADGEMQSPKLIKKASSMKKDFSNVCSVEGVTETTELRRSLRQRNKNK